MLNRKLALGAILAAGLMSPHYAYAADLGGSCCEDLDARVAELEATTTRKGNRKVSLQLYGEVNKSILWMDGLVGSGDKNVIDNSASPTRFGMTGSGKIDKNWSAGFRIEIEAKSKPAMPILQDQLEVRHAYLWMEGPVGRLSMGHTSMATDNITRITIANTDVVAPMLSLAPVSTAYLFGLDLPYNNVRRDLVRWDSPTFGGFTVAASVANGDTPLGIGFNSQHAWDVAIRYAGEFAHFRVAAGAGYRDENFTLTILNPLGIVRDKVTSGSASVMYMPVGLFVSAAVGHVQNELFLGGTDYTNWHVQAGWEKKVFSVGATTLYAEYGTMHIDTFGIDPKVMGLGAVQSFDAAALDIYASWRQYDLDISGLQKSDAFLTGMRIRF